MIKADINFPIYLKAIEKIYIYYISQLSRGINMHVPLSVGSFYGILYETFYPTKFKVSKNSY